MTTEEIISALKMGKAVYWRSPNYSVSYRVQTDELFVICQSNSHMIGVGKWHQPSDFYLGGGK